LGFGVAVGVGVGVAAGAVLPNSKAPISGAPTRGYPRWSVGGATVPSPASIAGLPASRARVGVGPPLLARTPSLGVPPMRLAMLVTVPYKSGFDAAVLPLRMVLR